MKYCTVHQKQKYFSTPTVIVTLKYVHIYVIYFSQYPFSGLSDDHPESYMNMAKDRAAKNTGWFDVNQYDNLDNPEGHYRTLGPEIWSQTVGRVTHFVAGGSTGGTITGTGKFLKSKNPDVKCVLADPFGSIFYEYFVSQRLVSPQKFLVEGVGKGSIPGCMDFSLIDDVVQVKVVVIHELFFVS